MESKYFPIVAVTNLDHAKTIHLAKGEIVGFAHDEDVEMNYIETTSTLEIENSDYMEPCNWVPARKRSYSKFTSEISEVRELNVTKHGETAGTGEIPEVQRKTHDKALRAG